MKTTFSELPIDKQKMLREALLSKGYTTANVFISSIDIEPDKVGKYDFKISVYRWNTSRSWVTELGARYDDKKVRYLISYYKMGNVGSTSYGAPGRKGH